MINCQEKEVHHPKYYEFTSRIGCFKFNYER